MKEKIIKMIEEYPIGTKLERVFDDYTEEIEIIGYTIWEDDMIIIVDSGEINYRNMERLTRRI